MVPKIFITFQFSYVQLLYLLVIGIAAGSLSMKMGEANGMRSGAAVTGLINGIGTFGAVCEGKNLNYSDLSILENMPIGYKCCYCSYVCRSLSNEFVFGLQDQSLAISPIIMDGELC